MTLELTGIFFAGLLTFFTPCVLPMIPIYLSALTGGDLKSLRASGKKQLIFRSVLFSIGFISVFTLLGLGASTLGNILAENRHLLQIGGALIILIFALKMLGVIRIGFLDKIIKADDSKLVTKFGSFNALIMGVVFATGWSPCVGPVLGSVLTYTASVSSNPLTGALYLFIYGAGFAIPLLVVSVFAGAGISFLSKMGKYLPAFEKVTGAVLLLVSVFMLHDARGILDNNNNKDAKDTYNILKENNGQNNKTNYSNLRDNNNMPVMYELFSDKCHICKKMNPIVDSLVTRCDKKGVRVKKINITNPQNRGWVKKFNIIGVPTFIFMDENGLEVARLVGEQTKSSLEQSLSALRGEACPGMGLVEKKNGNIKIIGDQKQKIPLKFAKQKDTKSCSSTAPELEIKDTDSAVSCGTDDN